MERGYFDTDCCSERPNAACKDGCKITWGEICFPPAHYAFACTDPVLDEEESKGGAIVGVVIGLCCTCVAMAFVVTFLVNLNFPKILFFFGWEFWGFRQILKRIFENGLEFNVQARKFVKKSEDF